MLRFAIFEIFDSNGQNLGLKFWIWGIPLGYFPQNGRRPVWGWYVPSCIILRQSYALCSILSYFMLRSIMRYTTARTG